MVRSIRTPYGTAGRVIRARPAFLSTTLVLPWVLAGLIALLCNASAYASTPVDSAISSYYPILATEVPDKVQKTLRRIESSSRRYLALSYYLRRADEIENGWSWTEGEVAAYRKTDECRKMLEEVESVRVRFAANNPGYTLRVNIGARSLGTQIRKWNNVSSVSRAAFDFLDSAERFVMVMMRDTTHSGLHLDSFRLGEFRRFMRTYSPRPGRVPTVAVPGLSKHGQLRAFDFKVYRGKRMIAGAHSRTIKSRWEKAGWTAKLKEAVEQVSPRFIGPLAVPYEPWHYNYDASILDPSDSVQIALPDPLHEDEQ